MSDTIRLQVVTYADTALEVGIKDLYIPAYLGEAGILENHKPYISLLQSGEVAYTDVMDRKHYLYIREGFIEVLDNKVSIICDAVEKGEELDREEIEAQLKTLGARIKSSLKGDISPEELDEALVEYREYEKKQKIIKKLNK